jgi:hypothetical protein
MALQDLDLIDFQGLYSLAVPTTDRRRKAANRFIVLFLSFLRTDPQRGSYFLNQLAGGQIKTNSDVNIVFSFASAIILDQMRQLAYELVPTAVDLLSFEFPSPTLVRLRVLIQTTEGDIVGGIEVSTT